MHSIDPDPETLPDAALRLVARSRAQELDQRLRRLERQVAALRESQMRRAVVVEAVEDLEARDLVALLVLLMARARSGSGRARAVLQQLALEPTVFREMPYARVEAAYTAARTVQLDGVARFFLSAALKPPEEATDNFVGNRHFDLPLGTRRSAARSSDRYKLDRLLHDRDHRVIAVLLDNPRITERDAIRIAAMRPTRPEVLEVVARHSRWSTRYRVRKALACNPATPAQIARRLLPTLLRQDLRHALESGVLPPELVPEVQKMLRGRDADTDRASSRLASRVARPDSTPTQEKGGAPKSEHRPSEETLEAPRAAPRARDLADDQLDV
jgi:hypothetical protein